MTKPTAKQISYLRSLGYQGPVPTSALDASARIAFLTKGKQRRYGTGAGFSQCSTRPTTTDWKANDSRRFAATAANVD